VSPHWKAFSPVEYLLLYALCQKAGTCARVNDARVQQLLQETDIVQLAVALDKELTTNGDHVR
jgi:hypothetical protein